MALPGDVDLSIPVIDALSVDDIAGLRNRVARSSAATDEGAASTAIPAATTCTALSAVVPAGSADTKDTVLIRVGRAEISANTSIGLCSATARIVA